MSSILKFGAILLVFAAIGGAMVGCGGDKKKSDDTAAQGQDFGKCLRDQGVEPPSGDKAPQFDPSKLQKALEECRDKLPNGGTPPDGVAPPGN